MNKYDIERRILQDDAILLSLCKAYRSAKRCEAWETANTIKLRTMQIYHFKTAGVFYRFVSASVSMQVSRRAKLNRLEKRINSYLEKGRTNFLTITFNDAALINNSSQTRKKYIRDTLNATCEDFVANIDFGKNTKREHYHAVSLGLNVDEFKRLTKPFGFIKIERVIPSTEGSLALYVDKLCNHALKETTCKQLIYCRKRKKV